MPVKGPDNKMVNRLLVLTGLFAFIGFAAVAVRLVDMQVIDYKYYQEKAVNNQTRDKVVTPQRGTIFDRNMKELAVSASTEEVNVTPANIYGTLKGKKGEKLTDEQKAALKLERQEKAAKMLSEILELDYDSVLKKIQKDTAYVRIKTRVEKDITDKIREQMREQEITGVGFTPDSKRYYPYGTFASHIIGFTGTDNNGSMGIELEYEDVLKGTAGRVVKAQNASGKDMPFKYEKYVPAVDGDGVVLTIDEAVQHFLEKHLETALADTKAAKGVAGIVMDVKTGEILAMSSKPDFDLNEPRVIPANRTDLLAELEGLSGKDYVSKSGELLQRVWRNKAINDTYEPGSTFKLFTVSSALEEGTVNTNSSFNCPGFKKVGGWTIKCWKHGGHGTQKLGQTLQNSCNVAMMNISEKFGTITFKKYFNAYGLMDKTGIDLPGEAKGIFFNHEMTPSDLATASFGQNFQVTPIEMINMVSAIVNDGKLKKPHIVKEIVDKAGNIKQSFKTEVVRQVISENTSNIMCEFMEKVVSEGTGQNAYVAGYRIGGKTATSEKQPRGTGKRIASFIGVAPMDDPQYAVLVMIDEPGIQQKGGGAIAAPVVSRIMGDMLPYMGVVPKYGDDEMDRRDISVPDLIGKSRADAEKLLKGKKMGYKIIGNGDKVTDQLPANGVKIPATAEIVLYMGGEKATKPVTVPNIIGMSVSQANTTLKNAGLYMKRIGVSTKRTTIATRSVKQSPAKNTQVAPGTVITVEFGNNVTSEE